MNTKTYVKEVAKLMREQQAVQASNPPSSPQWKSASVEIHRLAKILREEEMCISQSVFSLGSFTLLCHVHDHLWRDKQWDLATRLKSTKRLFWLKMMPRGNHWRMLPALLLLCATGARAQTISPVITEVSAKPGKSISGSFQIRNDGLVPFVAVIEKPQSLAFVNGKPNLQSLVPTTTLELSEMSARIGAKQSHEFAYRLRCETLPCSTVIYTVITGSHLDSGMQIALHLPSTIYACPKAKNCRASVIGSGGKP
jgi:hypothetical protein